MSILTPHTVGKLQEKYLKSGVMEGGWLGILPYHWRIAALLCVVILFLPESWVSENDFLMGFSYFVAEKIRIIFGLDIAKGTLKMYSPNVCLLYRVVVFLSIIICFFYNLAIKPFRFKEKVNYYWALHYWESSNKIMFILLMAPLFFYGMFYFGMIDSAMFESDDRWARLGKSRTFMAVNGLGGLVLIQAYFWGGIELTLGSVFNKVFFDR